MEPKFKGKSQFDFFISRYLRQYKYPLLGGFLIFLFIKFFIFSGSKPNSVQLSNDFQSNVFSFETEAPKPILGKDLDPHTATLFLEMPALGDQACKMTLENAFKQAEHPERIFFGVYQQTAPTDRNVECIDFDCAGSERPLVCDYLSNIIINRTDLLGARGPVYGRHMADRLYGNTYRDFIMIMDSHTMFRDDWDTYMINMWQSIDNEHAIITHYPWGSEHLERRFKCFDEPKCDDKYSYHICGSYFEGNHMPRNANGCHIKDVPKPVLTAYFAAGFAFARSHLRDNVPWDVHQQFVFWGEEFSFGSRAWTNGYDFYSPHADIVGHWYNKGPKRRSPFVQSLPNASQIRKAGEYRILYLWGVLSEKDKGKANLEEFDKYGLGNKRTLKQFWDFAGIDMEKQKVTVWDKKLYVEGGLKFVPWNDES